MRALVLLALALVALVACAPGASPSGPVSVIATTDAKAGRSIIATIANDSSEAILVPTGAAWCAAFAIERLDQGNDWVRVDACESAPTGLEAIMPGRTRTGSVAIHDLGVIVGSASPARLDVDLRELPAEAPPASGDLVPRASEMPIGILPSPSATDGAVRSPTPGESEAQPGARLAPGTYRLLLRYAIGSPSGPEGSATSGPFTILP